MKFFLDNCVSITLVKGIRIFAEIQNYQLVHLTDLFPPDKPDTEWIREIAQDKDWIIVSGDPRISRGAAERRAWHESGLTAFFLGEGWASQTFWKQAECLVHWWPKIVLKARDTQTQSGSGFLIPLRGKEFKLIYPPLN